MKCDELIFEIVPFCCGDIDEIKAKEFKRHITICHDCAMYYFRIRKTLRYLYENIPERKSIELRFEIK